MTSGYDFRLPMTSGYNIRKCKNFPRPGIWLCAGNVRSSSQTNPCAMKFSCFLPTAIALLLFLGCEPAGPSPEELYQSATFSERGYVQAVVEIPAGTNHKMEYFPKEGDFRVDIKNGRERLIDFLPYPGNYGYIPSTLMAESEGGDGDALDVLIIAESAPTGTLMEVIPLGALMLVDEGEEDTKIIAVPADSSLQVIQAKNFADFSVTYGPARKLVEDWFLNYEGMGVVQSRGWRDESYALQEISRWKKKKQ